MTEPPEMIGPYHIEERLGESPAGRSYQARHSGDGQLRALKVFPTERADDPAFEERFRSEAAAVAALSQPESPGGQPHIVALTDFGVAPGCCYLAMELLPKPRDLRSLLQSGHPWPLVDILNLVAQAADALDHAHRRDVIHRNLKPSNLLVIGAGGPKAEMILKIADFALPCLTDEGVILSDAASPETLTYTLSPERTNEQALDRRSDMFSLGIILYEVTTGYQPFLAKKLSTAVRNLESATRDPRVARPELPEQLDAIIMRCLREKPEERFDSAAALAGELRALLVGEGRGGWTLDAPRLYAAPRRPPPPPPAAGNTQMVPLVYMLDRNGAVKERAELTGGGLRLGQTPAGSVLSIDGAGIDTYLEIEWRRGEQVYVTLTDSRIEAFLGDRQLKPDQGQLWGWKTLLEADSRWLWLEPPAQPASQPAPPSRPEARQAPPPQHTTVGGATTRPALAQPGPRSHSAQASEVVSTIELKLDKKNLNLIPDQEATVDIDLHNLGTQVVRVRVRATGHMRAAEHGIKQNAAFAEEWSQPTDTDGVGINADQKKTTQLRVKVPRDWQNYAGTYDMTVQAFVDNDANPSAAEQATWVVLPFTESEIKATPSKHWRWRLASYTISVRNKSNAPATYELSLEEPPPDLSYQFEDQARVVPNDNPEDLPLPKISLGAIPPGKERKASLKVRIPLRQLLWVGTNERRHSVTVKSSPVKDDSARLVKDEIKTRELRFDQRAGIPIQMRWLVLLLLIFLHGIGRPPFVRQLPVFGGLAGWLVPRTTGASGATGIPTPLPTATPTPTPSLTATTTPPPTMTPTPVRETVEVIATEIVIVTVVATPSPLPGPTATPIGRIPCIIGGVVGITGIGPASTPYLIYFDNRVVSGGITDQDGRFDVVLRGINEAPGDHSVTVRSRVSGKPMQLFTKILKMDTRSVVLGDAASERVDELTCVVP